MPCLRAAVPLAALALTCLGAPLPGLAQLGNYQLFEAGQVRPLAVSPDDSMLAAVNTPDDHLEIFSIQGDGTLQQTGSVQVGLRPIAVAWRTNDEVWVVNHLSDSVSIVSLTPTPHVARTLIVGDEPRDIVFAGPQSGGFFTRAFISTAHRGQQRTHGSINGVTGAGDPQLTENSGGDLQVDRNDVWVFDVGTDLAGLGSTMGGTPNRILTFFSDTPRALATDGSTVYVAAFHSGNETTAISETEVCDGFQESGGGNCGRAGAPGGVPAPDQNLAGDPAPETGLIVKRQPNGAWNDAIGRDWSAKVEFDLPDLDVFSIDATSMSTGSRDEFAGVGTILFNMAINPVTGMLYVSNHESPNHVRFEGPGGGGSTVQGHLSETRITVIDPGTGDVEPKHLNIHLGTYPKVGDVGFDPTDKDHSLAGPMGMAVSSDLADQTIYLAAFGSGKIGVFNASDIEDASFDTNFDPTSESANYIDVGDGPSGLALDETRDVLFVLTRWNNSVRVVDVSSAPAILETVVLHNPEEVAVDRGVDFPIDGRQFLYDANLSSANGEASCSSCHIFGDFDSLAWNLGDPDGTVNVGANNQPAVIGGGQDFHPMKGPMTTQTLRGLVRSGGMHWRGDRVDGFFGTDPCTQPASACDENLSFKNFIVAFEGLVGGDPQIPDPRGNIVISPTSMQRFTSFSLLLRSPPNPVRPLDNQLTGNALQGKNLFDDTGSDGPFSCMNCHGLNESLGFFGGRGQQSVEGETQEFKIPHLRNAYAKIGMFGTSGVNNFTGNQVRGFGFLHDGVVDTVFNFLGAAVFSLNNNQQGDLEQYMLQFENDLAPIVGQQVTLHSGNHGDSGVNSTNTRIDLLIERAKVPDFFSFVLNGVSATSECELIANVVEDPTGSAVERGYLYDPDAGVDGLFMPDDGGAGIADQTLRDFAQTTAREVTYTCVPPGSGQRTAMDRDLDTLLNGVETNTGVFVDASDTGSNPAMRDTDGDGFDDDVEVNNIPPKDPNDPNDFPGSGSGGGGFIAPVPALSPLGLGLLVSALAAGGWATRHRRD